jgi:hypothetical protein
VTVTRRFRGAPTRIDLYGTRVETKVKKVLEGIWNRKHSNIYARSQISCIMVHDYATTLGSKSDSGSGVCMSWQRNGLLAEGQRYFMGTLTKGTSLANCSTKNISKNKQTIRQAAHSQILSAHVHDPFSVIDGCFLARRLCRLVNFLTMKVGHKSAMDTKKKSQICVPDVLEDFPQWLLRVLPCSGIRRMFSKSRGDSLTEDANQCLGCLDQHSSSKRKERSMFYSL